ncbi:MAG: DUF4105 domain-containing protein [Verrucomicrobiota bacterium]
MKTQHNAAPRGRVLVLILRVGWQIILLAILLGLVVWSAAALWIDGPTSRKLAGVLAVGFIVGSGVVLYSFERFRNGVLAVLGLVAVVMAWWFSIPARNDRNWQPNVAQLATADIQGNAVTIHNVRNFEYHSETNFTPHWETRRYDLDQIVGCDLFMSYWGPTLICHTISSWAFADGQHLAVSIETRKEVGEDYSALLGFFRQYELYYAVADERDVIGVRTDYRGENVYLYRINMPRAAARALLVDYLDQINRLAAHPKWYNALTQNCTTTIRQNAKHVAPVRRFNWRILANGYFDEMLYTNGRIDTNLPFAELRQLSDITAKAKAAGHSPDFSQLIRVGLPMP